MPNIRKKHLNTLIAIFDKPIRSDIKWKEIESLITALGGTVAEGNGSRVKLILNQSIAHFHRLHPSPDTDKGAIVSLREWLIKIGVSPNDYHN